MRISVREKRQITLPVEMCKALGIEPGDQLEATLEDGTMLIRPARKAALDALDEVRRAIRDTSVTREELLQGGREVREELVRERWPHLFPPGNKLA